MKIARCRMTIKKQGKPNSRYRIRAVERALALLKTFLGEESELRATEISKRIALDPSTTFRMLVTLQEHGFVRQDQSTGKYRLGASCLALGSQFLKINDVRKSALGVMEQLRNQFGETVHLGILDGTEIVYLEKVSGSHAIGLMSSRVGGRAPAHATSIGKILLAFSSLGEIQRREPHWELSRCTATTITDWKELEKEIARVREQGYAFDNQEFEMGVKCIAAPIYGHKGITAALSISGPVDRMGEHIKKHGLIKELKKAAETISTESGWGRGVDQIVKTVAPASAGLVHHARQH
jgi:IclR family transcriptional regulator, KDG regulon repressor